MRSSKIQRIFQRILAGLLLVAGSWQAHAVSLEELLEYSVPGEVRVSPNGKQAVFVLTDDDLESNAVRANLWIVDISSGESFQLTRAEERASAPRWSPRGDRIAFISDRTGAPKLWTISPGGGEAAPALPNEGRVIKQYQWLPDGGFAYLTVNSPTGKNSEAQLGGPKRGPERGKETPRHPIVIDESPEYAGLYEIRPSAGMPKSLTRKDYHLTAFDISPDGRTAVYAGQARPAPPYSVNAELNVLDLDTGKVRQLITQRAPILSPRFSPDGNWIAYVSQLDTGDSSYNAMNNQYLQLISVNGAERRTPSAPIDQDVLGFEWAGDGKTLYFWVNEHVDSKVYRVAPNKAKPQPLDAFAGLKALERGEGVSFSGDGRVGATAISDPTSPAEVYAIEKSGKTLRRLTSINQDFVKLAPKTEVLEYKGSDGLPLEALVIKPRDFTPGKLYPLLVIVHGGPPGVFTYSFLPRIGVYPLLAFMDAGYVVLLPNPRGSTGYGEQFRKANFRDLGGGDFHDILAGVDLLIDRGTADPERLGLMGWSYGGYMAYWAETHSTRFKAISAGAGISNLTSHHGTGQVHGYGQHDSIWNALPWEEPQLYIDHSALFFVEKAKTPLLIQHGAADPIVPVSQAHEFYWAARRVGLPVELVIYPDQPHPIQAPALVLDGMQRNLDWFNKWLLSQQD